MTGRSRGILLAVVQAALILLVWGRYARDRATLPTAWARALPVDPDDPLRGRYVSLWLQARDESAGGPLLRLEVQGDTLVAREAGDAPGLPRRSGAAADSGSLILDAPVAFFLSEEEADPTRLEPGEALWVQVSVPDEGMPRPLRLEHRPIR